MDTEIDLKMEGKRGEEGEEDEKEGEEEKEDLLLFHEREIVPRYQSQSF